MLLLFLAFVLVLGPQVVLSDSFKFSFSEVQQCEPLSISFKGTLDPEDPTPVTLTVLPFNGSVVSIPIPERALNSTSLNVSFLPLPEDSNFIASLDDTTGDNVGQVSDIVRVLPSDTTSCSLQSKEDFVPSFAVQDTLSQCENFTVRYDNGIAPTVRIFFPRGPSYELNRIEDDPSTSTATYLMVAPRQSQMLLMFNDTVSVETSALLSVQGDTSSSKSCFPRQNNMQPGNSQQSQSSKSGVSKSVAIGLGVGFGILLLLAIPMIWYVIRERRRNRKAMRNNEPAYFEKSASSYDSEEKRGYSTDASYEVHSIPNLPALPPKPARPPAPPPFLYNNSFETQPRTRSWDDGFVRDPAYVSGSYSPTFSDYPRSSISWEMITAGEDGLHRQRSTDSRRSQRNTKTILPSSKDLEAMLDVAGNDSGELSSISRNNSHVSRISRNSRPWGSAGNIEIPSAIHARTRSGTNSVLFPTMNPIQDIPQNVSFLGETATDDQGLPIFYESPASMGSRLRSSQASLQLENPGRLGSRFSAITTATDDSVGQIVQVHLQRPPVSASGSSTNNSSIGAEDGHGELGSDSPFRFPQQPTHYSPSPLARALRRESSVSMESWGNVEGR
ncbi:hypothetical protein VKT23_003571 [Stygiomarasmius scandens]|uniref:Axial budding pattern protein 2 n=1 Tax=Marasmiellus scandens TaxID=2682957 RepID=A0ABR1JXM8_9AGAR